MNCKPGDLAVIVRSAAGNEGKLVKVLRFHGRYEFASGTIADDVWICRCEQRTFGNVPLDVTEPGGERLIQDWRLRPIRDPGDDARDETLDWLPVPTTSKPAYAANFAAYIAEGELPLGRIWASRSQ